MTDSEDEREHDAGVRKPPIWKLVVPR